MPDHYKLVLSRMIFVFFLAFFSWSVLLVLLWSIDSYDAGKPYFLFNHIYDKPLNPLIIFGGSACCLALLIFLKKYCSKLDERLHTRLFYVFMGIMPCAQIAFTYVFQVSPKLWDFGTVYYAARGFVEGSNAYSYYFEDYPNNLGITLLLSGIYKLFDQLGFYHPHRLGLLFNILMIDLGLLFLYLTARKVLGVKHATLVLIMSLLFSPFLTYAPIYYTDTISLPMGIGMVYFFTLSKSQNQASRGWLYLFLASLLGVIGVILKPTVAILFVALLVYLWITENFTGFLKQAGLLVFVLVIGLKLYSSCIDTSGILELPYKEAGYPYTHWIMMGLKGPYGFYNYHEVNFTESFITKDQRKEANFRIIQTRVDEYGFLGLAQLFSMKNLFVWGDGTYFAPVKLDRGVPKYTALHPYILPMEMNKNYVYIYFCQIVNISLLLLLLLSGFHQLQSGKINIIGLSALAILGLGLFLLVWEARSRYLINFAPMILLCCAHGLVHARLPKWVV